MNIEPVDHRPVMQLFQAYLGSATTGRVGAQHTLNAEYFNASSAEIRMARRRPARRRLEEADVVLWAYPHLQDADPIYLANRGIRTANVPLGRASRFRINSRR